MSTEAGRRAESLAAEYLVRQGLKIIDRNWRTRWCEIDIVASTRNTLHFVEVKHRKSPHYGRGLEYITPSKQSRLQNAALAWVAQNQDERTYQIDVVEVAGSLDSPQLQYLPNIVTG